MRDHLAAQYSDDRLLRARQQVHERFSEYGRNLPGWVVDGVSFPAGADLLDAGCGNGRYFPFYEARQARVVGIDLFPAMLESARRAGPARLAAASADSLPFADRSFDVVFLNHMLNFAPDARRVLEEARRVLRRHGALAVTLNCRAYGRDLYDAWDEAVRATGREPVATAAGASYRAEDGLPDVAEVFGTATYRRLENAFVFATPDDPVEILATVSFARQENPPLSSAEVAKVEAAVRAYAARRLSEDGVWRVAAPLAVITAAN